MTATRRELLAMGGVLLLGASMTGCGRVGWGPGNPSTDAGEWIELPTAPLAARHEAVSAWVADRFVVVGGRSTPPCPPNASCAGPSGPAERDGAAFDPVNGTWTSIMVAPVPVVGQSVVVDDQLYVLVPRDGGDGQAFLRYGARTDRWQELPPPGSSESRLVAAADTVVAMAWSDENGAAEDEIFDPAAGAWRRLPGDPLGPSFDREGTWFDGRLLLAAKDLVDNPGAEAPALVRLAWWDPSSDSWSAPISSELIGGGVRTVGDRVVWPDTSTADGGQVGNWGRSYPFGGILDPATSQWTELPTPPDRDGLAAFGLVVGPRVIVGPAVYADRAKDGGHLVDPSTGEWTAVSPVPGPERSAPAVAGSDTMIFVWGGADPALRILDNGYLLEV